MRSRTVKLSDWIVAIAALVVMLVMLWSIGMILFHPTIRLAPLVRYIFIYWLCRTILVSPGMTERMDRWA